MNGSVIGIRPINGFSLKDSNNSINFLMKLRYSSISSPSLTSFPALLIDGTI